MDDVTALQERAQEQFDKLVQEKESLQKRIDEINTELVKLQGEYRAYDNLKNKEEVSVEEASTIKVEEPDGE